jgi:hypothetical protein
MSVEAQYKTSTLGLLVRHGVEPQRDITARSSYWGYRDPSANNDPHLSQLHGEGFQYRVSAGVFPGLRECFRL